MAFVYAWIVHLWADQLLPQLLMEQFDTLPIQCRHTEHMHEVVYNFCLHRFYLNLLFSKLWSAGLHYNLPSFSTDSYCAGVSNKHCLLTFFFCTDSTEINSKLRSAGLNFILPSFFTDSYCAGGI